MSLLVEHEVAHILCAAAYMANAALVEGLDPLQVLRDSVAYLRVGAADGEAGVGYDDPDLTKRAASVATLAPAFMISDESQIKAVVERKSIGHLTFTDEMDADLQAYHDSSPPLGPMIEASLVPKAIKSRLGHWWPTYLARIDKLFSLQDTVPLTAVIGDETVFLNECKGSKTIYRGYVAQTSRRQL